MFGALDDIAGAALFLASELSSFITGEFINVTGGLPWRRPVPARRGLVNIFMMDQ
jgi:NAD(P)-dependent dehydrogenase (short-subunit alcohol dehydrogenase family)